MNVYEAIKNRRSIRKFEQKPVPGEDLYKIIDAGRLAAFGRNLQALKFAIMENADEVYPLTKWAGYLTDWNPAENERPLCYIAVLGDTSLKNNFDIDSGAAISNMMLMAMELGLSTCWLGAINRNKLKEILNTEHEVLFLLAVGYPAQESKVVDIKDNDVKYYEDENGIIRVPKRTLDEVLVK